MLTLRPAEMEDGVLLWEWVNDPGVRGSAFNPAPIPWDGHVAWLQSRLQDPGCRIFIALDAAGVPVGQIRFEIQENGTAQIDVSVAPQQRGRGFGGALIAAGVTEYRQQGGVRVLDAWVREENVASRRSFERAGFRFVETTVARGAPAVLYRMEQDDER